MNKIEVVSLTSMLLPKSDNLKISSTESSFKDIFSLNNSTTKPTPTHYNKRNINDSINEKQRKNYSSIDDKKIENKMEISKDKKEIKNNFEQDNKNNNEVDFQKQEKLVNKNESNNLDTNKPTIDSKELNSEVNVEEVINDINDKVPTELLFIISNLLNIDLDQEKKLELNEMMDLIPSEIKDLIKSEPKIALKFIKENSNIIGNLLNVSKEEINQSVENYKQLFPDINTEEKLTTGGLFEENEIVLQIDKLKYFSSFKPESDKSTNLNSDNIKNDIQTLKMQTIISKDSASNEMTNFNSKNQKESFNLFGNDNSESYDLTSTKVLSNSIMSNIVKKVEVKNNQFSQMINKIVEDIKFTIDRSKQELIIKLQPESLGKLTVKINSENGILNASFHAENDKAKLMIENNLAELKNSLEKQGIQVQNLTVTVDQNNDELTKHQNLLQALKYNKSQVGISFIGQEDEMLENPYVIDDIFTDLI